MSIFAWFEIIKLGEKQEVIIIIIIIIIFHI